jgi:conjugative relaxase-like TrwC/TraI family protein
MKANTIATGGCEGGGAEVAWLRMMGADSVDYHAQTIVNRSDDHPGQALAYYASRGETPLVWGGSGAEALGLEGTVTEAQYASLYGPGGAVDPTTGESLTATKRPGMELVIGAHKSVAELGVIGRAEDMHRIMDAERDATLAYLDELTQARGGRRGRAATASPTEGLIYATTRHATSRAGDPSPHDHVLLANVVSMADEVGGYKAADTALWREHVHAATMAGRMAGARAAVDLGYAIVPDNGPSGRLGHWKIDGVPEAALELHSKRAAEITAEVGARGYDSYQARQVAARTTRAHKRHEPLGDLMDRWHAELAEVGLSPKTMVASVDRAAARGPEPRNHLGPINTGRLVDSLLATDGPLAERKVFSRRDVMVAAAPSLYGLEPGELDRVVDRTLADGRAVPLLGVAGARERVYSTASVIAVEQAVADTAESLVARRGAAAVSPQRAERAIEAAETRLGAALTDGQRQAVASVATSGRGLDVVVGVAGAGKTTALAAVRDAFESSGHEVVGTSTSGQAARTLGREAGLSDSRTLASLDWRLAHDRLALTPRHVVVLDEAAMTDDVGLLRLLTAAEFSGAKVVMVGDHRQLGPVGPGGSFEAAVERFGDAVHVLDENMRQRDPAERAALEQLRSGDVGAAVDFYASADRMVVAATRADALDALVDNWATDALAGKTTTMMAWRRANVAELNRLGRQRWAEAGKLSGPELFVAEGVAFAAGDRIVTLAPGAQGELVTSETGTVASVNTFTGTLVARMSDGRMQPFARDDVTPEHLAHGYAVTVHRSQGATVRTAHSLEDGGGRELAYTKMSRAWETSSVYTVADSLDQAVEDLARDWRSERRQRWAIDTGDPGTQADALAATKASAPMSEALRVARLQAERDAVAAAIPADPGPDIAAAQRRLARAAAAAAPELQTKLSELVARRQERQDWLDQHPEATARLARIDRELAGSERDAGRDAAAVGSPTPEPGEARSMLGRIFAVQRERERAGRDHDRGLGR